MKRFLVVLFTVALLVSVSAATFAAVDIGGNLRVWYKTNVGGNTGGFIFDRLALKVGASVSENNGFKSELRFFKDGGTAMAFDQLYYYQKNLFTDGDELNVGYVVLPFFNAKYISLVESLASKSTVKNSTGLKYGIKTDKFEGYLAITNWKNNAGIHTAGDGAGLDEALRVSFKVMDGLNIGVGYISDSTVSGGITSTTGKMDADILFTMDSFAVLFEYVNVTPNVGSTKSGMYLEPSLKISDNATVYAGVTFGSKDSGLQTSEYMAAGVKLMVAPKTALQAEYLSYPDVTASNSFNVRLRLDF